MGAPCSWDEATDPEQSKSPSPERRQAPGDDRHLWSPGSAERKIQAAKMEGAFPVTEILPPLVLQQLWLSDTRS